MLAGASTVPIAVGRGRAKRSTNSHRYGKADFVREVTKWNAVWLFAVGIAVGRGKLYGSTILNVDDVG